ncbi:response regulator [endosymbiont of Ridgeia piscesae]|jgi:CheY-like chemotaxis protein|uniref:CheY chemotaxis protein or a CheY-like REC (Receiver) domain n=1 Tax=endosymbiont of Ridgeia piscesae TaxID=54398 RepID=A0A0T5Z9G7_9GAMM|nr:response regulator [endosymbiont of Ridgeia piscesae]KRT55572.1 CheY chemotaxis protein or a CheY-like REC (receiver) domain [endosymbiont of Ridgeia piscesae]KRT59495.1 two-component system, cell cycle response regulator DivK [endosymbiont of Ridgeia piscesae]
MEARILVIEDNEQNLYMETFLLEKHGYEVVGARDGREGLELASRIEPALIVLDIQLPAMDGHEVARRLKQQPETHDIPIVAVTSYAMNKDREQILASGCEGYIEKPINPASFASELERYLPASAAPNGHEP